MANKLFFYMIIFLIVVLQSCKGTKIIDRGPEPERSRKEIIQSLNSHNVSYEWFTAEGKMRLQSPEENTKVKAYIRIKRDSVIWMVYKKLSVEASRILITPDSFYILYRLEQKFEKGSTKDILSAMNVHSSFRELQDYLIGNIPEIDTQKMKIFKKEDLWIVESTIEDFLIRVRINPYDLTLDGYDMYNNNNESLSATYNDYKKVVDSCLISYNRRFVIDLMEHGKSSAIMELKKIEIDVPKGLKFSIPSYYKEINYFR